MEKLITDLLVGKANLLRGELLETGENEHGVTAGAEVPEWTIVFTAFTNDIVGKLLVRELWP
jgi:hypothetical protein